MVRCLGCLAGLGLLVLTSGTAGAEIGSVAAVNRDMSGTPPTATRRALTLGNRVFQNERIETSDIGSGQLMFLDQTTLTVAPESDIVLDEYIYDPQTTIGTMTLSMGRGMLRLVGGRITKTSEAIVRTPTATVGIRGGMVLIEVLADGSTRVVLIAGEYALITDQTGQQMYLSRPNAEAEVGGGGLVFNGLLRPRDLARYYERLEGSGSGGASLGAQATDEVEARVANVAVINSEDPNGERRQPVSTSGESPVDPDGTQDEDVRDEERPDDQVFSADPTDPNAGGGGQQGGGNNPPVAIIPATGGVQFSGQNPATFTNIELGSLIGTDAQGRTITIPVAQSTQDFVDLSLFPGADEFSFGNGRPNAGVVVFDETAGAFSSQFGALEGFGFSDLDQNFHFYQFENIPADPSSLVEVTGFALFGNPSPNQLRTFTADTGSLDGETQNVVESFDVNNFVDFRGNSSPPALFVKNADIDRRDRGAGVRMIFAEERIEDAGNNSQNSEFGVYIGVDQGAAGVHFNNVFRGSENDTQSLLTTERTFNPVQTEAGATGRTVFGENDDYIVLAPVGGLPGNQQLVEGTFKRLGEAPETADFGGVLLERDPGAAAVIDDPLPLAGQNLFRGDGLFDVGAISGLAVCSNGNCGPRDAPGAPADGFYALRGAYGDSVRMQFNSDGLDTNAFRLVRLRMSDGELGNHAGGGDFFEFRVTQPGESGYADDSRFAVSQGPTQQVIAGVQSTSDSATLIMASSELLGYEGIGAPEFVRWGRWSSAMDVADGSTGARREDIVHMGTWVTGVAPDASLFPDTGSALYEGIALGTDFNRSTGIQTQVDGTFSLDYDFADGAGNFRLNLDTFSFGSTADVAFAVPGDPTSYTVDFRSNTTSLQATGGFFAGGGDQAAATGGEFVVDTIVAFPGNDRLITGTFAGDKVSD